ncbi:MAG: tRNA pseudouridine(38-40) synthase TruA [Chitinophagaceae bacterium]
MSRYFLEVAYKGTNYSGFQIQQNANTIQAEVQKAINTIIKLQPHTAEETGLQLTGSSRTDAGVHALQNFFHFDADKAVSPALLYKLNALLPADIAINNIISVHPQAHCRFDAVKRSYQYFIYQKKDPFLQGRGFYFPYSLDVELMQQAAEIIKQYHDFTSFSKRNTQVKTFFCNIKHSYWQVKDHILIYHVSADRFLRGMVRALTATMLKVGRKKITLNQFKQIIEERDCTKASFAVPAHGLFLISVEFPDNYFLR